MALAASFQWPPLASEPIKWRGWVGLFRVFSLTHNQRPILLKLFETNVLHGISGVLTHRASKVNAHARSTTVSRHWEGQRV